MKIDAPRCVVIGMLGMFPSDARRGKHRLHCPSCPSCLEPCEHRASRLRREGERQLDSVVPVSAAEDISVMPRSIGRASLMSCGAALAVLPFAMACSGSGGRREPIPDVSAPTFAADIAPLLRRECTPCHHPGGSAPFSLQSYEETRQRAILIAEATGRGSMPPWLPLRGDQRFVGERRLQDQEIATIARWVDAGAPPGDTARLPPAAATNPGWQLGEPDLVVELPAFTLPAAGSEVYRNLVAPIPVADTEFVNTVEVRVGNQRVVHHARVMIDTSASSRMLDKEDPEPGFNGMEIVSAAMSPEGFFIGWTPGKVPGASREDLAWRLIPGTDLVLQLHLRPDDKPQLVAPLVGLHFAKQPPREFPIVIMLGTKIIDIPAGQPDYVVRDTYELPVDVEVLGVYPHAHYLATTMEGSARLPDGSTRQLIRIPDWDFNWQDEYRYVEPLALPAGTVLEMRYTYDNSIGNPQNPNRPPRRVRYGPTSTDEMADLVVQVLPRDPSDLAALKHDLEWSYYTKEVTWWAYDELRQGDELAAQGRLAEAILHYREALGHRADYADAHHRLGRALFQRGEHAPALAHLREAVRIEGRRAAFLITLAETLAASSPVEEREEAVRIARRAVDVTDAADPRALRALATAYAAAGDGGRALRAAERAIAVAESLGETDLVRDLRREAEGYRNP